MPVTLAAIPTASSPQGRALPHEVANAAEDESFDTAMAEATPSPVLSPGLITPQVSAVPEVPFPVITEKASDAALTEDGPPAILSDAQFAALLAGTRIPDQPQTLPTAVAPRQAKPMHKAAFSAILGPVHAEQQPQPIPPAAEPLKPVSAQATNTSSRLAATLQEPAESTKTLDNRAASPDFRSTPAAAPASPLPAKKPADGDVEQRSARGQTEEVRKVRVPQTSLPFSVDPKPAKRPVAEALTIPAVKDGSGPWADQAVDMPLPQLPASPGSTTAAPPPFASTSPEHVLARHAVHQVAVAVTRPHEGATDIRLDPEELGQVKLSLQMGDTAILVTIHAERPETADLMRRHIDLLAQEFRSLGYQDVSFSFGPGQERPDSATANGDRAAEQQGHVSETAEAGNPAPHLQPLAPAGHLDLRL